MNNNNETQATWNKVAQRYQEMFMELDIYNPSYDLVVQALKSQKARVLDIGCGPGNITSYLLKQRPDLDVLGIDYAFNMIELAKRNNPTAKFAVMDTRQISSLQTAFDAIFAGFCVPYLSPGECDKLFSDCFHLLEAGGVLYCSFVEGDPAESGLITGSTGDRTFFHYHRLNDVRNQMQHVGFYAFNEMRVAYTVGGKEQSHTIVIAQK